MVYDASKVFMLDFGCDAVPVDTEFVWPGFPPGGTDALEMRVVLPVACVLAEAYYWASAVPGAGVTDTYTFYVDGVTSGESFDVGEAATAATWTGAVAYAAGEAISIYFTTSGATTADDVAINCVFRRLQ